MRGVGCLSITYFKGERLSKTRKNWLNRLIANFRKPVIPTGPKYGFGLTVREETGAVIMLNVDARTVEEACAIVARRDGFGEVIEARTSFILA
jgi:hypothetical protein